MIQDISYNVGTRPFGGLIREPSGPPSGSVLVFHGGGGIAAHERSRLEQLAAIGYVAFAPDLFGEKFSDRTRAMVVIGQLVAEPELLRARCLAALEFMSQRRLPVFAIGHCFGGLAALELARTGAAVRAVVSFHGSLATKAPAKKTEIHAKVLACTGAGDPFCPREQRVEFEEEMTNAAADWQHHVYGGAQHGFSVKEETGSRPGVAYHEESDRRSWKSALDLIASCL